MRAPFRASVRMTAIAVLGAVVACNGVLGIEQAELDTASAGSATGGTSTGGTSSGGTSGAPAAPPVTDPPVAGCIEPDAECSACFASCTGFDKQRCLANGACRKALDGYRTCLGGGCTGGEACREAMSASPDADVQALVGCLSSDACATNCESSTLATMCELYCACMTDNCGSKFESASSCLTACQATASTDVVYCRKMHCEFLELPNSDEVLHCEHAMGIGQCQGPITVPPGDCNLAYPGFPCHDPTDCCNPVCNGQVCG